METVEFRLNNGNLEYRCLLINDACRENWLGGHDLYIDYKKPYSEWKSVPEVKKEGGKKC